jgi:hypothetical protein
MGEANLTQPESSDPPLEIAFPHGFTDGHVNMGPSGAFAQFIRCRLGGMCVDIGEEDAGALSDESVGDGPTDALSCTGDDGLSAFQARADGIDMGIHVVSGPRVLFRPGGGIETDGSDQPTGVFGCLAMLFI